MTFDPFGDFDTHGYLRNTKGLKDPEAVRLFEHTAFRLNIEDALAALRTTARPLGYQDVMDTHKRLFGAVYPWAGQDREALAPQVAIGKGGRYDLFAHPRDARRAVEHALRIAWQDVAKADYLAALTRELEWPGRVLDAFLAPHVHRPAASVTQDAERLRTLPGFGPASAGQKPDPTAEGEPGHEPSERPGPRSGPAS